LGIVIASAITIVLLLCAAVLIVRGRAQRMVPVRTKAVPSQSMLLPAMPAATPKAAVAS